MDKRPLLTKVLAIIGTVLLWLPIAAMAASFIARYIRAGMFAGDYLLSAELFPLVAVGALLLLWAAIRARSFIKPIILGMAVGLFGLVVSQLVAVVSGLASGEREAVGWPWVLVVALLVLYDLAVIFLGVIGVRLSLSLFRTDTPGN